MKGWFALLLAMMSASAFADKRSGDYWYTLDDAGNATITTGTAPTSRPTPRPACPSLKT